MESSAPHAPPRSGFLPLLLIVGFALLAACGGGGVLVIAFLILAPGKTEIAPIAVSSVAASAPSATVEVRPPTAQEAILYGAFTKIRIATPARFDAPLPASLDGYTEFIDGNEIYPPEEHVHDLLCAGDESMERRFLVALRAASRSGVSAEDLRQNWGELLTYCNGGKLCPTARQVATGTREPAPVRAVYWQALAECPGKDIDLLFEGRAVPAEAVVARFQSSWLYEGQPTFSKRLEEAVREMYGKGIPNPLTARMAAFSLGDVDDPRAAKALLQLYGAEQNAGRKRDLAMAMRRQRDPKAHAVYMDACQKVEEQDFSDPVCDGEAELPRASDLPDLATGDLTRLAASRDVVLPDLVKANSARKPEMAAALAACAESSTTEEWRADQCLRTLVTLDRGRAATLLASLPEAARARHVELAAALRYTDLPSLYARLWHLGLLEADPSAEGAETVTAEGADTAKEVLLAAGRASQFDTETGTFPNHHDSLLRELAALTPALARVAFEEVAPEDGPGGGYTLHAYMDGERYSVPAKDHDDWYDVAAVLGLLNVLARERQAYVRFAALSAFDQTATVIVGPEAGIKAAAEERLVTLGWPDGSMEIGRDFEDCVLDDLKSGRLKLE